MCEKNRKGFSLIELLVVVSILGVLSSVAIVSYNNIKNSAKSGMVKDMFLEFYQKYEMSRNFEHSNPVDTAWERMTFEDKSKFAKPTFSFNASDSTKWCLYMVGTGGDYTTLGFSSTSQAEPLKFCIDSTGKLTDNSKKGTSMTGTCAAQVCS